MVTGASGAGGARSRLAGIGRRRNPPATSGHQAVPGAGNTDETATDLAHAGQSGPITADLADGSSPTPAVDPMAAVAEVGPDGRPASRDGGRSDPARNNGRRTGRGRRRGGRRDEHQMVPDATFTSYYGRPVVKASPWEKDIPAYLFLGGVAAGSSLLGAGADLTGRPVLRQAARISALGAISVSFAALVHDLGRPMRFINMLRVAKPTSPMSVGTWLLVGYGPAAGLAGGAELTRLIRPLVPRRLWPLLRVVDVAARPAGLAAAGIGPGVAAYTAVLLADTATPTWHAAHRHLPFVFVGSAAAASGGLAMITSPTSEAGPARRLALGGALLELSVEHQMEAAMGITAEPLHQGNAGRLMRASRTLTAAGAVGSLFGRRSRIASVISGAALVAGSACTRFGVFSAGQDSARDPKYTVVPQRERVEARRAAGAPVRSVEAEPATAAAAVSA